MQRIIIFLSIFFISYASYSQAPQRMSWQGVLTDDLGVLLDGNYNITLQIFDVQSNGVAVWSETHNNVIISEGLANLTLGSVNPLNLDFSIQYWLELTIGSGTPLSRIALNSVPYALYAQNTSNEIQGSTLTIKDNLGNIRIQFNPDGSKIHLTNDAATTFFKAEESIFSSKIFNVDKTIFSEILQQPTSLSLNATSISATGNSTFNNDLSVVGDAYMYNGFFVNGYAVIDGQLEVYDHTYFDQTFNVAGDVTFDNNLSIGGATTLTGNLVANGGGTFKNGLNVTTGNVLLSNNFTVGGVTILNGNFEAFGLSNFKNGLNVTIGDVAFFNNFTVAGTTTLNGTLETNSSVNFKGGFNVPTGNVSLANNFTVGGLTTLNGILNTNANVVFNAGFSVPTGNVNITNNLTVGGLTTLNGGVEVNGVSNFNSGLNVTAGDVTLANKLIVNNNTNLKNELDVTGPVFLNMGLDVLDGDVSISNDLWVTGSTYIGGDLSVTGQKNFRIDYPKDPYNKYLYHASIESDDVLNQYSGNITTDASGTAKVTLPDYVQMINTEFRYQLTVIGEFAQAIISKEFSDNSFEIKTDKPNVKVSWQITAKRNDEVMKAKPFIPVRDKEASKRGTLLFNLTK